MELIKANEIDTFTVAVNGSLPQQGFEFIDTTVISRQAYYYGVVAVGLSDEGKWLRSRTSTAMVGQAFKITPPEPPTINRIEWVRIDEDGNVFAFDEIIPEGEVRFTAVRLEWIAGDPDLKCLVQFSADYFESFQNASEWLAAGDYSFIHNNTYFYFDHTYRIQVTDQFGNMNDVFQEAALPARGI
jgi:hypothetical protein